MKDPKEFSSDKILQTYQELNEINWSREEVPDDKEDEIGEDDWDDFSNDDYFD